MHVPKLASLSSCVCCLNQSLPHFRLNWILWLPPWLYLTSNPFVFQSIYLSPWHIPETPWSHVSNATFLLSPSLRAMTKNVIASSQFPFIFLHALLFPGIHLFVICSHVCFHIMYCPVCLPCWLHEYRGVCLCSGCSLCCCKQYPVQTIYGWQHWILFPMSGSSGHGHMDPGVECPSLAVREAIHCVLVYRRWSVHGRT